MAKQEERRRAELERHKKDDWELGTDSGYRLTLVGSLGPDADEIRKELVHKGVASAYHRRPGEGGVKPAEAQERLADDEEMVGFLERLDTSFEPELDGFGPVTVHIAATPVSPSD